MYRNKLKKQIIALPAVAGLAILLAAFSTQESQRPVITSQPEDQMIRQGTDATLAVAANNGDSYQWLRNGVAMPGQTRCSLNLPKAKIMDAGNYSCVVSKGLQSVASRVAALLVYVKSQPANAAATPGGAAAQPMGGGGQMTVFASPVASGGSSGSCPGHYAGYVIFFKTSPQGWGWTPTSGASTYTAADGGGRSDTIVQYGGLYGDSGCNDASVTVHPVFSPVYRFAIFFPNNVPTTNYPITLTGFNP
jgi:Immunoglobulin domain